MNLKNILYKYISCSTNNFYTIRCPFHNLGAPRAKFKVALQSSIRRLTKRCDFTNFTTSQKTDNNLKKSSWHLISDQFYLLISLEGVQSIIAILPGKMVFSIPLYYGLLSC